MLRMVLLGLLIPLGVGVLSAMELGGATSRDAVAIVEPAAETTTGISDSRGTLAKSDRLEVTAASSEMPAEPALADERASAPQAITAPSQPAKPVSRHRHDAKPKKVAVAPLPKSKPRAAPVKQANVARPSRIASDSGPCRLKAFGGLLKALGSADCEI